MKNTNEAMKKPIIYDVVGIGFGPSSISQVIALSECGVGRSSIFFEAKDKFSWHPGMLFPEANMQVSFLKDLVTLRNPVSPFSFLNYLHAKDRLVDYSNLSTLFPSRIEFSDYLEWCADQFNDHVHYSSLVKKIELEPQCETNRPLFKVTTNQYQNVIETYARAIFYCGGIKPKLPCGIETSDRIFHSHDFLHRLRSDALPDKKDYVVVGSGQSAAEVVSHIYNNSPYSRVTSIIRGFGIMPADDSPFVNQVFDPASVDLFFKANDSAKSYILDRHSSTNYAVVDIELIEELYRCHYQDKVLGQQRIDFRRLTDLVNCSSNRSKVTFELRSLVNDVHEELQADYIICATGFEANSVIPLLDDQLKSLIVIDKSGQPEIRRDYSLNFSNSDIPPIYVPAMAEHTHGLSATLISNMSIRSGEMVSSLESNLSNELTCRR